MAATSKSPMTTDWLLQVCGASSLEAVKSVNLWAKSLRDSDVTRVLAQCTQLEVASLSLNKISSLEAFAKLSHLKELFLRKNEVEDISELRHLQGLPLTVLWLSDNPVEKHALYRPITIRLCPSLEKLDKQGQNVELDALVAQVQAGQRPAARSQAGGAARTAAPSTAGASQQQGEHSATVLRAVQELLPLLSQTDLQQVARTVDKLL